MTTPVSVNFVRATIPSASAGGTVNTGPNPYQEAVESAKEWMGQSDGAVSIVVEATELATALRLIRYAGTHLKVGLRIRLFGPDGKKINQSKGQVTYDGPQTDKLTVTFWAVPLVPRAKKENVNVTNADVLITGDENVSPVQSNAETVTGTPEGVGDGAESITVTDESAESEPEVAETAPTVVGSTKRNTVRSRR